MNQHPIYLCTSTARPEPYTYVQELGGRVVKSFPSSRGQRWLFKVIAVMWECEEDEIEFIGDDFKVKGEIVGWVFEDGPTFTELPPESPLMATARRAAERVDTWSPAKQAFANRVTGAKKS